MKYGKFHLNIGEKKYCESGEVLEQVTRRCFGISILRDIQTQVDMSWADMTLLEQWVGLGILRGTSNLSHCGPVTIVTFDLKGKSSSNDTVRSESG